MAAQEDVRLDAGGAPRLPQVRLQNRSNLCYIHSVLQAVYWLEKLSTNAASCFGRVQAGMKVFQASGSVSVLDSLPLRTLFAGWGNVHQQHDAGEFLQHFLAVAQSAAYQGRREARQGEEGCTLDSGTLGHAIILPIAGVAAPALQTLLDGWHRQHTLHAVVHHSGVIWLQLERYAHDTQKCTTTLRVRPGDRVAAPLFSEADLMSTMRPSR